ncbi:beta-propeller domain-containing protein [Caldalkalibacillus salinus]|uniref:beta-propeller domain-containing protein n=1 Tax=Caldalkalibacillus salinus TaxID=2803787 RepID=UPI0019229398|nr:beta-propeller domain-containing protein [Caldalkalibacillus salinus]
MSTKMKWQVAFGALAMCLVVGTFFILISEPAKISSHNDITDDWIGDQVDENELPTVQTAEQLHHLIKQSYEKQRQNMQNESLAVEEAEMVEVPAAGSADMAGDGSERAFKEEGSLDSVEDYSGTNVQVQGVDEADVIKTNGEYLYQVQGKNVQVTQIYPASEMELIDTLTFDDQFYPNQLYLDHEHLVVIGAHHIPMLRPENMGSIERADTPSTAEEAKSHASESQMIPHQSMTKAYVYAIDDPSDITLVREVEIEGGYLTSRKIGSSVYLLTNQFISFHDEKGEVMDGERIPKPLYSDTTQADQAQEEYQQLDYGDIAYFPGGEFTSYLNIAGFNLNDDQPVQLSSYLGAGQNVYGSQDHLYVSITQYDPDRDDDKRYTEIYQFAWEDSQVTYNAKGEVPGHLLNQFSMDEHEDHLRVAVTSGDMWNEQNISKNHLYVLNHDLQVVGKVEDLAPGERIYSVRFMGDRGYMVTFRTVDPLFVLDLEEPTAPSLLGELKIPGYSDYLHPYDENHLIGFGKETEVHTEKGHDGSEREFAVETGMKMSLFDVTDVHNPKEKFVEYIGDRGTHSELLHNHKALLFSKKRNLLAFPAQVREISQKDQERSPLQSHGAFTFQGALVYDIDLDNGFQQRGGITHLTSQDKNNPYWHEQQNFVQRIIYVNDTLYTISKGAIKANQLDNLDELNTLSLPEIQH